MASEDNQHRLNAEQALRLSEQRFRATFNQATMGIAIVDLAYYFLEVNRKFTQIVGYPLEDLRKLTFADITHPEDLPKTRTLVQQLNAGEIPQFDLEKRYIRKDGSIVWSHTTVTILKGPNGEPEQYIGIVQDISERRQAEELRNRLAAVVECSDDAIVTKTLEGIITTWNQGAQRMFGYTADEAIGRSVTILIPPEYFDEEPTILERLKRGERIDHYETVRRRKDGTLLNVSLSVSPIKDGDGNIVGASKIARDITQHKRSEEALRESDRRKDEFLATLAHELRNPLAPIRHAATISKAPNATEAQKRWSHEVISRQVQHMALLLDDLLDISRITRGILELRVEPIELSAVIDAAIETAHPAMEAKDHTFTCELPEEPVRLAADPMRLAQALSNLLTNAAKYTDPKGRIHLRVTCDADFATIALKDNGIGIPPRELANLFAMFSQVKSSQDRSEGGLGIGLALVKGILELHGGTIEARSEGLGRGSEFIVRLPLAPHLWLE